MLQILCFFLDKKQSKVCLKENGFCVSCNGKYQNSGVIKVNSKNGNTELAQTECLKHCHARSDATGCEVIWDQSNRGCYIHTKTISKGNGKKKRHLCWVFSKCTLGKCCYTWRVTDCEYLS